ncbi:hypothetical protein KV557_39205 [Kitasatospora aureofaciens]|uniref:hypothetical protein n=1 Tax=Kitasatospora aureofaciens TaxID=1894 RepID=UPI001C47534D|nr:hypothetical protein [Kitasatospora aureofaciens]MBV6703057.1 hypothetical protein [Kitasatospora aureofaciens]
MATHTAYGDSRRFRWLRVREFAVPPTMIETATARRLAGDWAGACAAAGFDVDLNLRAVARTHGRDLAARIRADLRVLAPDLLRWHMPRTRSRGLLMPAVTVSLARYDGAGRDGESPVHLVVRTPPWWADGGQRIALVLWDGSEPDAGAHPHPRPSRRHRLDLHRHLWDASRADELRARSGADRPPPGIGPELHPSISPDLPLAVDRWVDEARILLRADGLSTGPVRLFLGGSHRLLLDLAATETDGPPVLHRPPVPSMRGLPALPDAATCVPPDVELLRAGLIEPGQLHPLVAAALAPGHAAVPRARQRPGEPRLVDCRGARHRIGLVDGVLAPLDHDPAELRREELLVALTGTPLPCLQEIDRVHRDPECLGDVRGRLDHGDTAGAVAVVEALLGPDAVLRDGPLRDALEEAEQRRITYGLYRAGLTGRGPLAVLPSSGHR